MTHGAASTSKCGLSCHPTLFCLMLAPVAVTRILHSRLNRQRSHSTASPPHLAHTKQFAVAVVTRTSFPPPFPHRPRHQRQRNGHAATTCAMPHQASLPAHPQHGPVRLGPAIRFLFNTQSLIFSHAMLVSDTNCRPLSRSSPTSPTWISATIVSRSPPRTSCQPQRACDSHTLIQASRRYTCSLLVDLRMDANRFFAIDDCITRLTGTACQAESLCLQRGGLCVWHRPSRTALPAHSNISLSRRPSHPVSS
jgi:hypothetical protein